VQRWLGVGKFEWAKSSKDHAELISWGQNQEFITCDPMMHALNGLVMGHKVPPYPCVEAPPLYDPGEGVISLVGLKCFISSQAWFL
jgi:hypothetical protein